MNKLRIVRIHNELLGTYGDRGNGDILAYRAEGRGISTEIIDVAYRDAMPSDGDIYLLGGAEDAAQILSCQALLPQRNALNGKVVLAICAGFQIMGNTFYAQGNKHEGLGFIDMQTIPGDKRYVGDIKLRSALLDLEITGFENHGGATSLNSAEPFGEVLVGHGNGDGKVDGAILGNYFGTYLHGPILARNPEFADLLLARAVGSLAPFEDELANRYAASRRAAL